jgi:AcrR family transcriptional regulator
VGFAEFSAREVAKRIGYTIGTIHNVFGNVDGLLTAITAETFDLWAAHLRVALATGGDDRIAALVHGYFDFARANPQRWNAIYDHRPNSAALIAERQTARGPLTLIVVHEVAAALARGPDAAIETLARSLIATVHGHCSFAITGSWEAMDTHDAADVALARVREILAAAR